MPNRLHNEAGEPLMTAAQMHLEDALDAEYADQAHLDMDEMDMQRADAYAEQRADAYAKEMEANE